MSPARLRNFANTPHSIVLGAAHGRLSEILPKLSALHAKNNFSFALLLGDVFASSSDDDDDDIKKLLNGEINVPLPTYFTLGTQVGLPPTVAERVVARDGEVVENLFFLGKKGVIKTSEGVRIVAVGRGVDAKEVNALKGQNYADILVTSEWPAGVERYSASAPAGVGVGDKTIAELVRALRPRYHFVPGGEVFFEREPYRNQPRNPSEEPGVTRFYALADWGNDKKAKAMFAFSINVSEPPPAIAQGTTACPYEEQRGTKRAAEEGTFFWGDHTAGRQERPRHKRRHQQQHRPPPGPDSCFFCLSYPQLEKHLIVSIGSEAYLTTAKGPLTDKETNPTELPFSGHILIIPFSHTPTLPLIEDPDSRRDTLVEMRRYKDAIEKMLQTRGAGAVTFEVRRQSGVHAHWQVIPVKSELLEKVDSAFDEAAKKVMNREFEEEAPEDQEEGDAFTYWVGGREKGRSLRLLGNEYFDLQFGRRVLAGVIGAGERRVNWRDCVMPTQEESLDAQAFKEAFKEFDFSLEE
jgi:diadenosine tetraphosphate (Ap4A) HIT family hydrolase